MKKKMTGNIAIWLMVSAIALSPLCVAQAQSGKPSSYVIEPLKFKGEPFFVLGTYDPPKAEDAAQWKSAGGNTVLLGHAAPPESSEEIQALLKKLITDVQSLDAAHIYFPGHIFFEAVKNPALLPLAEGRLDALIDIAAEDPQTLGYWTVDEPENKLYEFYKESVKGGEIQDASFGKWLSAELRWTYERIKQRDPERYVMPTIGWWTVYEETSPLYDVNVANEYPTYTSDQPMTGPLYNVVYDAAKAAEAIRSTDAQSFLYMPGICDNWPGDDRWRAPTRLELRYIYFAPITQGAQGILSWRLGRSSQEYRSGVIYPTMREVNSLIPWFLGEWCDGMVRSNRDKPSVDYLQNFPERIRTVENEGRLKYVPVKGVPDVSHMVRRHENGSYLILAVNNRKEATDVTFRLDGFQALPASVRDRISWDTFDIVNKKFNDRLEPFAVRAYIIDAAE